jgi:hypothetical protein
MFNNNLLLLNELSHIENHNFSNLNISCEFYNEIDNSGLGVDYKKSNEEAESTIQQSSQSVNKLAILDQYRSNTSKTPETNPTKKDLLSLEKYKYVFSDTKELKPTSSNRKTTTDLTNLHNGDMSNFKSRNDNSNKQSHQVSYFEL